MKQEPEQGLEPEQPEEPESDAPLLAPERPFEHSQWPFMRRLGKLVTGRELEGRVGHFCVGGRCKAAHVVVQRTRRTRAGTRQKLVDLRVVVKAGKISEQYDVPIRHERLDERSFHLLTECDKIEIKEGEYRDAD